MDCGGWGKAGSGGSMENGKLLQWSVSSPGRGDVAETRVGGSD